MTTENSVPVQREAEQASTPHSTPGRRPTLYPFRAAATNYAKAGLPIFRMASLSKRTIKGSHGFKDATTDPEIIQRWVRETPAANVALRTGLASRVLALDVDPDKNGEETLALLEAEIGPLPETRTHRTPRGGWHYLFLIPEGIGPVKCSARDGLDVRGDGGLLVMPPSVTENGAYEVEKRIGMAEATPELLRWARDRSPSGGGTGRRGPRATVEDGERIPEGSRNDGLTSICGRLHDGTRDLPRLIEDLMAINEERCDPPWPYREVEKTARSIHAKTPCRPRSEEDPELTEVLQKSSDHFYSNLLKGGGKSKKRDVYRTCLNAASARRELITLEIDGETRRGAMFSDSCRQIAEEANTSAMSVSRHLRALCADGVLLQVEEAVGERSATWALMEPAQDCYTPVNSSSSLVSKVDGGVTLVRTDELTASMNGWRDPVGNAGGGVEVAVEARPMQTTEELADMLGISRPRDLERRHLRRLEKLGVLEERNGLWARPADHRVRAERLRNAPYATVTRRKVRRRTNEGRTPLGRVGTDVDEIVVFASPAERSRRRREKHDRERAMFRERRRLAGVEGDDACRDLLNAWDGERYGLIPEVNWPEVVDGVIVHHDECGCSWCEPDPPRRLLLASGVA